MAKKPTYQKPRVTTLRGVKLDQAAFLRGELTEELLRQARQEASRKDEASKDAAPPTPPTNS